MKYFDEQFGELADNCFGEINRVLNEIVTYYVPNKSTKVVPYGSYAIKSNYQLVEPMEFFVVLPSDKEKVVEIEAQQKRAMNSQKKKKNSIKSIYQSLTSASSMENYSQNQTAFDVAKIITTQLQKYLNSDDRAFFKNNVVFIKLHIDEKTDISAVVYIGYQFENNEIEFSKFGYKTKEDITQTMASIMQKNNETNGNFLLLCKLIKMLELELVLNQDSNVYLSKKSIFVENLLYNIPNEFFDGNDYSKMFTNVTNYLKHADSQNFYIAGNPEQKMFDKYGYYSITFFNSIQKKLSYLSESTDEIIAKALELAKKLQTQEQTIQQSEKSVNQQENIKKIKKR